MWRACTSRGSTRPQKKWESACAGCLQSLAACCCLPRLAFLPAVCVEALRPACRAHVRLHRLAIAPFCVRVQVLRTQVLPLGGCIAKAGFGGANDTCNEGTPAETRLSMRMRSGACRRVYIIYIADKRVRFTTYLYTPFTIQMRAHMRRVFRCGSGATCLQVCFCTLCVHAERVRMGHAVGGLCRRCCSCCRLGPGDCVKRARQGHAAYLRVEVGAATWLPWRSRNYLLLNTT